MTRHIEAGTICDARAAATAHPAPPRRLACHTSRYTAAHAPVTLFIALPQPHHRGMKATAGGGFIGRTTTI
ncbi:MAG: hypothetical protein J6N71_11725 [Muribaculaceae bacterium]|nr:hypothetical protein [Muribaculaceae bacterium]